MLENSRARHGFSHPVEGLRNPIRESQEEDADQGEEPQGRHYVGDHRC
jgi:hypothetical protein